jgi:hypothetical protein
MQGERDR